MCPSVHSREEEEPINRGLMKVPNNWIASGIANGRAAVDEDTYKLNLQGQRRTHGACKEVASDHA